MGARSRMGGYGWPSYYLKLLSLKMKSHAGRMTWLRQELSFADRSADDGGSVVDGDVRLRAGANKHTVARLLGLPDYLFKRASEIPNERTDGDRRKRLSPQGSETPKPVVRAVRIKSQHNLARIVNSSRATRRRDAVAHLTQSSCACRKNRGFRDQSLAARVEVQ